MEAGTPQGALPSPPAPIKGFGLWGSGVQQWPWGRKGQIPPPGYGSTQSHACGAEHVCQRGGGHGKGGGAGHTAAPTGTRMLVQAGMR